MSERSAGLACHLTFGVFQTTEVDVTQNTMLLAVVCSSKQVFELHSVARMSNLRLIWLQLR